MTGQLQQCAVDVGQQRHLRVTEVAIREFSLPDGAGREGIEAFVKVHAIVQDVPAGRDEMHPGGEQYGDDRPRLARLV